MLVVLSGVTRSKTAPVQLLLIINLNRTEKITDFKHVYMFIDHICSCPQQTHLFFKNSQRMNNRCGH